MQAHGCSPAVRTAVSKTTDVGPAPAARATGGGSKRRSTSTSSFGVGRREGHDSSGFYARFAKPQISDDETVNPCPAPDSLRCADSRDLSFLPDACVALVVTSPPYFVGKAYEADVGQGVVPAGYAEYLAMLADVFAECARVLEPGGRIAVDVANLGRKPYRSLSGDVSSILEDLGLLPRGEIVWIKGKGANGSCAWGSYASPANPVLRDVTERIVVASKGRFDRAIPRKKRAEMDLPHVSTIYPEDFRAWTLDTWYFPPESAKRVGHPAPFPPELPRRLIELYTYRGDVVLDPFAGAGTVALAAKQAGRRYVCVDADETYVELARRRLGAGAC